MTPKRLKQLAQNPRHIPGVYNYCDRWCERCPLTARCLNYAMGQEALEELADDAPNDSKIWKTVSDNMRLTMELLAEECREQGIDLDAVRKEANSRAAIEAEEARDQRLREHPLARESFAYTQRTDRWFKAHRALFEESAKAIVVRPAPNLSPAAAADLSDAAEIVRWYDMFIGAKLARAVGQQDDDGDDAEDLRNDDAHGSAKVALIAMDRSLAAWARIRARLPADGDEIIDVLLQLDRLRHHAESAFPAARAFVRPGFDDGTLDAQP